MAFGSPVGDDADEAGFVAWWLPASNEVVNFTLALHLSVDVGTNVDVESHYRVKFG